MRIDDFDPSPRSARLDARLAGADDPRSDRSSHGRAAAGGADLARPEASRRPRVQPATDSPSRPEPAADRPCAVTHGAGAAARCRPTTSAAASTRTATVGRRRLASAGRDALRRARPWPGAGRLSARSDALGDVRPIRRGDSVATGACSSLSRAVLRRLPTTAATTTPAPTTLGDPGDCIVVDVAVSPEKIDLLDRPGPRLQRLRRRPKLGDELRRSSGPRRKSSGGAAAAAGRRLGRGRRGPAAGDLVAGRRARGARSSTSGSRTTASTPMAPATRRAVHAHARS